MMTSEAEVQGQLQPISAAYLSTVCIGTLGCVGFKNMYKLVNFYLFLCQLITSFIGAHHICEADVFRGNKVEMWTPASAGKQ